MEPSELTRLKVGDEGFLVASLIERCPRVMMLRELVRNAIEAAATAPDNDRSVEIDAVPVDGTPKLRIRNSGRGMDAAELFRMADLAASIRKRQGLDGNFGMGAKVASLPSNRLGLRYRSCQGGVVRETLLGWRDGAYGRIRQPGPDGNRHEVLALTDAPGEADWTEVVLFGNDADQDTSRDPYQGAPPMQPDWLHAELSARFFRIDDDVRLRVLGEAFEPLSLRLPRIALRHEIVLAGDGIRLHYAHVPPGVARSPAGSAALVHRGELYDNRRGQDWLHMAPVFGVPFAAAAVVLLVELPDAHPVVPDAYRQFLRHAGGRQDTATVRDFAALLHANRPPWLRALIDAEAPSAAVSETVYLALQDLLRTLGVRRRPRAVANGRTPPPAVRPDDAQPDDAQPDDGQPNDAQPSDVQPDGEQPGDVRPGDARSGDAPPPPPADAFDAEPVPEILMLRLPEDIVARGLVDRAGRYYPESHQLFLNGDYPAVRQMRETLERAFAADADPVRVRSLAFAAAERALAVRVGRMLVFALSRQGHWPDQDVAQALSPHALCMAADDWQSGLDPTLRAMRVELEAATVPVDPLSARTLAAAAG